MNQNTRAQFRAGRVAHFVVALAALVGLGGSAGAAIDAWEAETPALLARANGTGGVIDGLCYLVGGQVALSDCTYSADLQIFDPVARTWSLGPAMTQPRFVPAGATLGGKLYVAGGGIGCGPVTNGVEAYDPGTGSWTTVAAMTVPRIAARAATAAGKLYVFGGHSGAATLDSVEAYDPNTNTWSFCAPMPRARLFHAVAELGGKIYVLGGQPATDPLAVDVYDPATNSWSAAAPIPELRNYAAAVSDGGLLYVSSGQGEFSEMPIPSVIAYDPDLDAWHEVAPLITARMFHVMLAAAGQLYVFGGMEIPSPGVGYLLTSAERYLPATGAPAADAGPDQTLEATSVDGAVVSLDGTGSSDPDGDTLTYVWDVSGGVALDDETSPTPSGTFPVGVHMVTVTVSDGHGGFDTDDVVIQVTENDPPQALCTTDTASLWPPKHQMVDVEVRIVAIDALTDPEDLVLVSVKLTSDEPDDAAGTGDGATTGDVQNADGFTAPVDVTGLFSFDASTACFVGTVKLRAERSGTGDGRSYGIEAVVQDASGNSTSTSCVVVVPHSRGK